jgi:hypothetical protein
MFSDPERRRVDLEIAEDGTSAPFRGYMAAKKALEAPGNPIDRAIHIANLAHSDIARMLHQPSSNRTPSVRFEEIREGELIATDPWISKHLREVVPRVLHILQEHRDVARGRLPLSVSPLEERSESV